MCVVGVDFGASGAAIVLDDNLNVINSLLFDKVNSISQAALFFIDYKEFPFIVEKVGAAYGDGGKSLFSFGKNVGRFSAAIEISQAQVFEIPPQAWTAYYKAKYRDSFTAAAAENKLRNEIFVRNVFGDPLNKFYGRSRYHSGAVDAYLIARYGILNLNKILEKEKKQTEKDLRKSKAKAAPRASYI